LESLRNAPVQFPFKNFEEVLAKANRYSTIGARMLAHKQASMDRPRARDKGLLIKRYVFKLGFRDGWAGFVIAFGNFEGTFYRYAKRYEEIKAWQRLTVEPLRKPEHPVTK
jgi:hypothetical protein